MNDEQQIRELLMTAAELPEDLHPPVARLLHQGRRHRARRTALVAVTAAVAVVAAAGIPAALHGLRAAPYRPSSGGTFGGLFGPRPGESATGPAAAQLARFRWSTLAPSPLGGRTQPVLAWTGRELIEVGGVRKGSRTDDGAAFSPATGRWRRIASPAPLNIGTAGAVSVWTGRQLFVTSGQQPDAGLYNPVTNRWTQTRLPSAMDGLYLTAAAWTGRDVILAGVNVNHGGLDIAAYNPATGRWRTITPGLPPGHRARYVAMTATTGRLILWSLWDRVHGSGTTSGVDVLALGTDGAWRDVTGRWPQHRVVFAPFFTGSSILISPGQTWCGARCRSPYDSLPGFFANPVTLARTTIPAGPLGSLDPPFVWTGRLIIAVNEDAASGTGSASSSGGGSSHVTMGPGISALFDPATRRWQRLPKPPGYPHLSAVLPVWAGNQMLALTARGQLLALHG